MKKLILLLLLFTLLFGDTDRLVSGQGIVLFNSEGVAFGMDDLTNSLKTIDYEHSEIHDGRMFTVFFNDLDLDNTDSLVVLFATKDTTRWSHLAFTIEGTVQTEIIFYENVTVSDSGTLKLGKNRNRNSSNLPLTRTFLNPNVTDYGTVLDTLEFGDGRFDGGTQRSDLEWILKQNSLSLIRINSKADNNILISKYSWYEHNNR